MRIHSTKLFDMLTKVKGAMPNAGVIREYERCVHMSFNGHTLTCTCTDGSLYLTTESEAEPTEGDEQWDRLVEIQPLLTFTGYVSGEMTLKESGGRVRAQCGKPSAKIPFSEGSWPLPPLGDETGRIELSKRDISVLKTVSMSEDKSADPRTEGISFVRLREDLSVPEEETPDDEIAVHAITSNRLFVATSLVEGALKEDIVLRISYAEELLKSCADEGDETTLRIGVHNTMVHVDRGYVKATAAITDATTWRPDLVGTIRTAPVAQQFDAGAAARAALKAIKDTGAIGIHTAVVYSDEDGQVRFWLKEQPDQPAFESAEIAECEGISRDAMLAFNGDQVLEFLGALGKSKFIIAKTERPMFILESGKFRILVMPMRFK